MIESPLLQKLIAGKLHGALLEILKARFGPVPRDVTRLLRKNLNHRELIKLAGVAAKAPDLDAFREALLSRARRRAVRRPSDHPEAER
jgi:hypothetical protein